MAGERLDGERYNGLAGKRPNATNHGVHSEHGGKTKTYMIFSNYLLSY